MAVRISAAYWRSSGASRFEGVQYFVRVEVDFVEVIRAASDHLVAYVDEGLLAEDGALVHGLLECQVVVVEVVMLGGFLQCFKDFLVSLNQVDGAFFFGGGGSLSVCSFV